VEEKGYNSKEEWCAHVEAHLRSKAVILVYEDERDAHLRVNMSGFEDCIDKAFFELIPPHYRDFNIDRFAKLAKWTQSEKAMFEALMTNASLR